MEVLSPNPDPLGGPPPDSRSFDRSTGGASTSYDSFGAWRVQQYVNILQPQRPWLGLYNSFVKVTAPAVGVRGVQDPALLHKMLPEDFLFEVSGLKTLGRLCNSFVAGKSADRRVILGSTLGRSNLPVVTCFRCSGL